MKGLMLANYSEYWEDIVSLLLDQRQAQVRLFLARFTFQTAAHAIWRERERETVEDVAIIDHLKTRRSQV